MSGFRDQEVQCPNCESFNVWFAEICTSCGTALAGTELETGGTTGQPTKPELSRGTTKTCRSCGGMNDGSGRFCTSCGAELITNQSGINPLSDEQVSLELSQSPTICPRCGALNYGSGRFCIACGSNLIGASLEGTEKTEIGEAVKEIVSVWKFIKGAVGSLFWLYATLVGIHVYNGLGWGASFGAPINDFKLFIDCPTKVQLIWDFVNRDPDFDDFLRAASEAGESLIPWICQAGSLY